MTVLNRIGVGVLTAMLVAVGSHTLRNVTWQASSNWYPRGRLCSDEATSRCEEGQSQLGGELEAGAVERPFAAIGR